jgi:hypothetical protein
MQIANPPNWDLQKAQNGSNPDIYIGCLNNNLRDFFKVGRDSSCGLVDLGSRIADFGLS